MKTRIKAAKKSIFWTMVWIICRIKILIKRPKIAQLNLVIKIIKINFKALIRLILNLLIIRLSKIKIEMRWMKLLINKSKIIFDSVISLKISKLRINKILFNSIFKNLKAIKFILDKIQKKLISNSVKIMTLG